MYMMHAITLATWEVEEEDHGPRLAWTKVWDRIWKQKTKAKKPRGMAQVVQHFYKPLSSSPN
jgi:hypothetical protein